MAVLSDADRLAIVSKIGQWLSNNRVPFNLSKTDVRAAVNAADDWADANAASYNSALPVAARTTLTTAQKAQLLAYIILRRWEVTP